MYPTLNELIKLDFDLQHSLFISQTKNNTNMKGEKSIAFSPF